MKKFPHLDVPHQWEEYWTKYPHGYTIFEALCSWTKQVDSMVDNQNTWNDYLDNFVKNFDIELQEEVQSTIEKWQNEGLLDGIIESALNTELDNVKTQLADTVDDLKERAINIKQYNHLVDSDDWTNALSTAIKQADGKRIVFPNDGTIYKIGRIIIENNVDIDAQQSKVFIEEDTLFDVKKDLETISLRNFNAEKTNIVGDTDIKFLNIYQQNVGKVIVEHNNLKHFKVFISGDYTSNKRMIPQINGNIWEHGSNVRSNDALLTIRIGKSPNNLQFGGWVTNNFFNVHHVSGENKDIVKISAGASSLTFKDNYIKNNNLESDCEVDLYTGGHKARIVDNHFINCSLKRQQQKDVDGSINSENHFDQIKGNTFEFEDGARQLWGVLVKGSLFNVSDNTFKQVANNANYFRCIYLNISNVKYDDFNTISPTRGIIKGNIADLRKGSDNSSFINISTTTDEGYFIISQNLVTGGRYFSLNKIQNTSLVGNIWVDGWGGTTPSVGGKVTGSGNIFNGDSFVLNQPLLPNATNEEFHSVNSPNDVDASKYNRFYLKDGVTIKNIIGGYKTQEIILLTQNNTAVIESDGNILLKEDTNFTMPEYSSIKLIKLYNNRWLEIGRSTR